MGVSRENIALTFAVNPDDGEETADIDEFLDVSHNNIKYTSILNDK